MDLRVGWQVPQGRVNPAAVRSLGEVGDPCRMGPEPDGADRLQCHVHRLTGTVTGDEVDCRGVAAEEGHRGEDDEADSDRGRLPPQRRVSVALSVPPDQSVCPAGLVAPAGC